MQPFAYIHCIMTCDYGVLTSAVIRLETTQLGPIDMHSLCLQTPAATETDTTSSVCLAHLRKQSPKRLVLNKLQDDG
jgi:hypothetical protein